MRKRERERDGGGKEEHPSRKWRERKQERAKVRKHLKTEMEEKEP